MKKDSQYKNDPTGATKRPFRLSSVWLLILASLATLIFYIPFGTISSDIPEVGDISTKEVIAPFSFPIMKTAEELAREKGIINKNVPVILNFSKAVQESVISDFEKRWMGMEKVLRSKKIPSTIKPESLIVIYPNLSQVSAKTLTELRKTADVRQAALEILSEVFAEGIFDWKSLPEKDSAELFNIFKENKSEIAPADRIATLESVVLTIQGKVSERFKAYPEKGRLVSELIRSVFKANLIPDIAKTDMNRREAVSRIKTERGLVLKDQRIVDAHEKITEETHQKLVSLTLAKSKQISKEPLIFGILKVLVRLILATMIIYILANFIILFFPAIWGNGSKFSIIMLAVWLPGFFHLIIRFIGWPELLTPISFSAALIAMLFGPHIAIAVTIASAIIVSIAGEGSHLILTVLLVEGIVTALASQHIATRRRIIRPIAYTVIAGMIATYVLDFISLTQYGKLDLDAIAVTVSSIFGPLLAVAVLPLFERLSGVVSDFTLVELANTNAPVLQQLAIEAPGTFYHSIVVSNLAEATAKAIGANPVLARVGALYHDIGKLSNPDYFSENLTEENPHDQLSPETSFEILSSHVDEGVRLASIHKLPEAVRDIIRQHHGTSVMRFFYELAKVKDGSVEMKDFRYPGPRPSTREAAIVMLADSVEAMLRSVEDPDLRITEKIVGNIIEERISTGQLSECDLTTKDLNIIKETFVRILEGVSHRRQGKFYSYGESEGLSEEDKNPSDEDFQ